MNIVFFGIIRAAMEFIFGAEFIRWLGTFVEDERGHTSAKRFALIFSVTVSGAGILWLVACRGIYLLDHEADIGFELAVLMLGASGTGGLAYMLGKPTERKGEKNADIPG